jgi:hypothetical protein
MFFKRIKVRERERDDTSRAGDDTRDRFGEGNTSCHEESAMRIFFFSSRHAYHYWKVTLYYQTTNSDGSLFYITVKLAGLTLLESLWHQRFTLERHWLESVCACFLIVDLLEVLLIQAGSCVHAPCYHYEFFSFQLAYVQHTCFFVYYDRRLKEVDMVWDRERFIIGGLEFEWKDNILDSVEERFWIDKSKTVRRSELMKK